MRKQNFLGLFGISVACFMVIGACYAATTSTLLYTFDVMKPTTWCPPLVTVEQGDGTNGGDVGCYRITTTPQVMGANGCEIDTSTGSSSSSSGWVCNACPPLVDVITGDGEHTNCYQIIVTPQIMGDNGCEPDANGTSSQPTWVCNGTEGASAYQTWLNQEGNSGKSEEDFLASLKGENGTACTTTVSRDAATGKTLIEATCGENTQSAEIDEDTIATGTVNKIRADNTIALKEDLTIYATTEQLNGKLSASDINATFLADKLPANVVKTDTLTTTLAGYATTEQLNGKLSANDINATFLADKLPNDVVKTDGNGRIPSDKIPALTADQMPSDYATIKADAAKGATALQSTDLSQALTDAQVIKSTDTEYLSIKEKATGALQKTGLNDALAEANVLTSGNAGKSALEAAVVAILNDAAQSCEKDETTGEVSCTSTLANTLRSAVVASGATDSKTVATEGNN